MPVDFVDNLFFEGMEGLETFPTIISGLLRVEIEFSNNHSVEVNDGDKISLSGSNWGGILYLW